VDVLADSISLEEVRKELEELLPMKSFWWLLESAPDGIILVNNDKGSIMLANAQAAIMFGYPSGDMIGMQVEQLMPGRFLSRHKENRMEYGEHPRTRPMGVGLELYGRRSNGTEFPLEISLSPVKTKEGLLVMAIIRDVTEYKREHYISETLQRELFNPIPDRAGHIMIASSYRSAYSGALVGGDFMDVILLDGNRVGLVIGDVSGKGIDAAARTALAKYSLRGVVYEDPDPKRVMERINLAILKQVEMESYITLFYGLIDQDQGILRFCSAGHLPGLYLKHGKPAPHFLNTDDIALGILQDTEFHEKRIGFNPGDRLLLYTDGVTEARDGKGFYGINRLRRAYMLHRNDDPRTFVDYLTEALLSWSGDRLRDDIAMLAVEAGRSSTQ